MGKKRLAQVQTRLQNTRAPTLGAGEDHKTGKGVQECGALSAHDFTAHDSMLQLLIHAEGQIHGHLVLDLGGIRSNPHKDLKQGIDIEEGVVV